MFFVVYCMLVELGTENRELMSSEIKRRRTLEVRIIHKQSNCWCWCSTTFYICGCGSNHQPSTTARTTTNHMLHFHYTIFIPLIAMQCMGCTLVAMQTGQYHIYEQCEAAWDSGYLGLSTIFFVKSGWALTLK